MRDTTGGKPGLTARTLSRRRFLRMGCLGTAAAGLALCGLTALAPDEPPAEIRSFTYGDKSMNRRVLVVYASAMGSTAGVAAAIGEALGARGLSVDVIPAAEKPLIEGYQAVVIGSAVHYGRWLPEALDFARGNAETLKRMPVAVFCVHIQYMGNDEASRKTRLSYLDDVRALLIPAAEAFFPGKSDRRTAAVFIPAWAARFVPTIDLRNWKTIRSWADGLAPVLLRDPAP